MLHNTVQVAVRYVENMKETLKKEVQEYFGVIERRNNFVYNQIKDLELFYEIDDDFVNKEMSKKAISFLKKTGLNFEKKKV